MTILFFYIATGMNGTSTNPEYKFTSSPQSDNGNSSMIFERTVEDGCSSRPFSRHGSSVSLLSRKYSNQSTGGVGVPSTGSASRCGHRTPRNSQQSSSSQQGSPLDSPDVVSGGDTVNARRHLENFVAPALDASCSIIADDSADLNDLDVVYMRKPSTIGLDLALGRTRSNSYATLREEQQQQQQQRQADEAEELPPRSNSSAGGMDPRPRTLRFYSYADMLSDEMATSPMSGNGRPPLLHSASSTFLRPAPQHQPMHFSNPFKNSTSPTNTSNGCSACGGCGNVGRLRKDSMTSTGNLNPHVRRCSNNVLSRSSTTSMSPAPVPGPVPSLGSERSNRSSKPRRRSAFQIELSGSDEFSSDEEDEAFAPSNSTGFSPLGSRVSRTNTQNSISSQPSSKRASGGSFSSSNAALMKRESLQSSINGLLMEDTLQTEKVGDILRKRMGNVKRQDLKVTTGEN